MYLYSRKVSCMKLENSTSSFDTIMAQEMAVNQVVTEDQSCLNKLSAWIKTNSAKLSLVWILTFVNPNMIDAQTVDVAKNDPKKKIENTVWTAKKDTNSVELKVEPEWRRELDKALLNTLDYMNKNFDQYNKETLTLGLDQGNKIVSRFKYIWKYAKKISSLSWILAERPFTTEEIIIVGNIQKTLEERSKEWLHRYLDKLSYLNLQEANALALSFKNNQIVKN